MPILEQIEDLHVGPEEVAPHVVPLLLHLLLLPSFHVGEVEELTAWAPRRTLLNLHRQALLLAYLAEFEHVERRGQLLELDHVDRDCLSLAALSVGT